MWCLCTNIYNSQKKIACAWIQHKNSPVFYNFYFNNDAFFLLPHNNAWFIQYLYNCKGNKQYILLNIDFNAQCERISTNLSRTVCDSQCVYATLFICTYVRLACFNIRHMMQCYIPHRKYRLELRALFFHSTVFSTLKYLSTRLDWMHLLTLNEHTDSNNVFNFIHYLRRIAYSFFYRHLEL